MSVYRLRPALDADAAFICAVKLDGLRPYVEQIWGWDDDDQRRRFFASFDPAVLQVIRVGEEDVGFLHVAHGDSETSIDGIYVSATHRGQGIGSAVLRDVIEGARAAGRNVRLQVLKPNPARALYERVGFRVCETTDTHFKMVLVADG